MNDGYHFEIGQLVEHVRYGYRGVVAARDPICKASASWYRSNQTQPPLDQPWYHVLVHGGTHTTYAAQISLAPDEGGEQVVHPLSARLFEYFRSGQYIPRSEVSFADLFLGPDEV